MSKIRACPKLVQVLLSFLYFHCLRVLYRSEWLQAIPSLFRLCFSAGKHCSWCWYQELVSRLCQGEVWPCQSFCIVQLLKQQALWENCSLAAFSSSIVLRIGVQCGDLLILFSNSFPSSIALNILKKQQQRLLGILLLLFVFIFVPVGNMLELRPGSVSF